MSDYLTSSMPDGYNYLMYSQEQLNRAIELLKETPNEYVLDEIRVSLEILARTKPVYKKAYGTGELVQVGKLTAKNEIIFDLPPNVGSRPKTSIYPISKNLGISSNVYYAGWFTLTEANTEGDYYSYYEIVNRHQFQEILYSYSNVRDDIEVVDCPVLGFMMGDYRSAEVVFYDQYREV